MATASTRSLRSERQPLLPPAVVESLIARLIEAAAFALIALGVILAAALATYDPSDPSWSVARTVTPGSGVRNLLGRPGAWFSDVFLQTLGLAAYLVPMMIAAWGLRLLAGSIVRNWSARIVLLMAALIVASMALAYVPAFDTWPLRGEAGRHLGGSVGGLLLGGVIRATHGAAATAVPALVAGALATAALIGALGCRWAEWKVGFSALLTLFGLAQATGRGMARVAAVVGGRGVSALRRQPGKAPRLSAQEEDEDEDDLDPPLARREPVRVRKPEPAAPKVKLPPKPKAVEQPALDLVPDQDYALPPLDLLHQPSGPVKGAAVSEQSLQVSAEMLIGVLGDFGVKGEIVGISPGPVVTLYELEPAPGTKSSRVIGLADDIARSMSAISVRVAVVPGRNVIGIEMPNARRETVYLREMLASESYERTAAKLALILGKDIGGQPIIADLARMPHLLVAGTTGSGKSVGINAMILSLLYRMPPDKCRFIMIDPKMLELSVYDDIPHLLTPVVTDPKKAVVALKWTVREMEDRYRAMSKLGVRNIEGYNARLREARASGETLNRRVQTGFEPETGKPVFEDQPIDLTELPYIVVVVDEFADLMLVAGKDIEAAVQRLAQMARAAGIHLLMATQRPSVDVITGTIKANFPTRISFQVTSKIDSRTILGESGAEQLLGQGDMLHMAAGGRITRVHGPFVRDDEVEAVVKFLKDQGEPQYVDAVTEGGDDDAGDLALDEDFGGGGSGDDLYDRAVALVARERKASTSFVQRHLQIGYNRAARIIERMEKEGVVSQANHVGKREVLARDIDER